MALKEYKPGTAFTGVIGRTFDVSSPPGPSRCAPRRARRTCCSSCRTTPASARWAATAAPSRRRTSTRWPKNGLRFNNMHTTALCSPTRSCILTGRNHHSNAMSCITEGSTGYPGGNGNIPFENGFLSEILLQHGYNTYALGKWHLTPADQISAAGPYDRWPLGRGFERYYGFLGGDTHQYYPDLVYDNHTRRAAEDAGGGLPPDRGPGGQGDQLHRRLQAGRAEQAVLHVLLPRRRCTRRTTCPKEWADKYKGKFDDGWDAYREKVFEQPEGAGHRPPGRRALAPRSRRAGLGHALGRREEALRPHDGGVRRLPDPHRPPLRPAVRLPARRSASGTTRSSCSSPTTAPAPRAARPARSTRTSSSTTCPTRWRRT